MKINNTSNLRLELILLAFVTLKHPSVTITELTVRRKKEGIAHGNFGKYYPLTKSISLVVPESSMFPFGSRMRFTGESYFLKTQEEFLVAVLAHELRHAWQFQVEKRISKKGKYFMVAREVDCELWELEKLAEWRKDNSLVTPLT